MGVLGFALGVSAEGAAEVHCGKRRGWGFLGKVRTGDSFSLMQSSLDGVWTPFSFLW